LDASHAGGPGRDLSWAHDQEEWAPFFRRDHARTEIVAEGITREMANVVVVGAQWGDEGKGKIVDW
jgi:hypothetical protein